MESDNVKLGEKVINKYPEVFESLLEFEKTKKLRKIYRRKRLNVTIDENVLRDFKNHCQRNNINMSRFIEKKMIEAI